jgi:hypothetical protein
MCVCRELGVLSVSSHSCRLDREESRQAAGRQKKRVPEVHVYVCWLEAAGMLPEGCGCCQQVRNSAAAACMDYNQPL